MTYQEFKERFHIRLNPQQESAVRRTEGPVLLLAVPGSGKTTVLVTRLGYLLYCKGVPPEKILTVTYTVAAAGDMAHRFETLFGSEHAGRLAFRTINGLCATVIHTYARKKGASPFELVTSDAQLNGAIRDILIRAGADYPTELQIKDARTQITFCKSQMLTDAEIQNIKVDGMDFPALYTAYQAYLKQNRLMDYDDQMVFAYRILRQHPDILAHYQRKYRYLCVDEAQCDHKFQPVMKSRRE